MQILILTMSAKRHNFCVAGIDLEHKRLVRLVSDNENIMFALSQDMILYSNKKPCQTLDVVDVKVIEERPLAIQKENLLIDTKQPMTYIRKGNLNEIVEFISNDSYIFGNTFQYINKITAMQFGCSIKLYEVNNIKLVETTNNQGNVRKKVDFEYKGHEYTDISMTDCDFFHSPLGEIARTAYIVVSIPEDDFNGHYYKFVSKIFVKE